MDTENADVDENPFLNFKISEEWKRLHSLDNRSHCSKCLKSRKYFCYSCYLPVMEIEEFVPNLKLPLKVDIIKHSREIVGKSTAVHAAVLAPSDVTIYTYPTIPDYSDEKVILVFPSKEATPLEETLEKLKKEGNISDGEVPLTKVVFIDSTWNQSRGIYKDPRIQGLPCVVLKTRISQFWRHQKGSPRWHLATIEAIHQFFLELEMCCQRLFPDSKVSEKSDCKDSKDGEEHCGKYDNLLFFFRFMYDKIHTLYNHDDLHSYKRPLQ